MKNTFAERLKTVMDFYDIKQAELSEVTKVPKSAISQYLSGEFIPRPKRVALLANFFGVTEEWLMGYDVPFEINPVAKYRHLPDLDIFSDEYAHSTENNRSVTEESNDDILKKYPKLKPIPEMRKVPLLGAVACGKPIYKEENEWISLPADIKADFCLRCEGDSMIDARINDGDIVFIKACPEVENGQIAAVSIDNEVTLKRVFYYPEKNKLVLYPENKAYEPFVYMNEELNDIRILGKAVVFLSKAK